MAIQNNPELDDTSLTFNPSEAKLCLIIDTIPVIAWRTLADGSGEFWNQRWHDYTGMPLEAARGWGWRAAIYPDDLDRIEQKWRAEALTSEPFSRRVSSRCSCWQSRLGNLLRHGLVKRPGMELNKAIGIPLALG